MADQPKRLRRHSYIDRDTSDAFLDGPEPLRTYDGEVRETRWDDVQKVLDEGRAARLPTDAHSRLG